MQLTQHEPNDLASFSDKPAAHQLGPGQACYRKKGRTKQELRSHKQNLLAF